MADKISLRANAKINLLLDILGSLQNGYHSLYMIMQSVDLYDTVSVSLNDGGKTVVSCTNENVPTDQRNTAYKAALAFFSEAGLSNGADIAITKRIPMAAGLAGGSADAAAVLVALNELTGNKMTEAQLCAVGVKVGADIPFCITGGTALSQNIGEVLSELPPIPDCYIVLAKPSQSVSTGEAYAAYDTAWWIRHPKNMMMLDAVVKSDLDSIALYCENVFEQVVDVPRRADIKYIMREAGAIAACMSGSGPTVFGIFRDLKSAQICAEALKSVAADIFITKPAQKGIYPDS